MIIEVKRLHFSYGSCPVLEDVTLEVEKGEVVSLVGPNGSGKTTLLKCLNKILKPKKGTVLLMGKDVSKMNLKELARLSGYVPQNGVRAFPSTVFDIVLLGRRPYIEWRVSLRDKEIVSDLLRLMGLEEMALRDFNELSGGQKQKVLIARAFAQEPEILLLDEPTSNLDLKHQLEVMNLVSSTAKEKGVAAIISMHDLNLASRFSDKMVFLREKRIYAIGRPEEVLTPDNVRAVYGVETVVNKDSGRPYIIPLEPLQAPKASAATKTA
ncbi:ABC transporter ATP-binding protein [Calderihabitans maritimus]|uniref:Probable ABC transporter, ATP-binding protein n=1 Tax=Calderihabitans maritimus TaxID=1246530 RepID=A0A1Z5HRP2_9FIRM|nr:ABC transporter ATP-binding protein [Calderihabitans maritimus]GAW92203.1 probable ABC transporter, ATP-binding protein [Calderihabitans maritimus]